jgi:asparagine synthase (glutamine-hydrolysing)
MCGIFCVFEKNVKINDNVKNGFQAIQHRGPDRSQLKQIGHNAVMGFHRLAIMDVDKKADQPFTRKTTHLVCNGEIFNHKQLEKKYTMTDKLQSQSDCEKLMYFPHSFNKYHKCIPEIDGEFAVVLYNSRLNRILLTRDPFGVRPLFVGFSKGRVCVSSEAKALLELSKIIIPFLPGHYAYLDVNKIMQTKTDIECRNSMQMIPYFDFSFYNANVESVKYGPIRQININNILHKAVSKRMMSDRKIGCLLSGGLDSSLITSIVHQLINDKTQLHCFTIGLENSMDVIAAKKVAAHLNLKNHHIIEFTVQDGFDAIEQVIYSLESYDITTIRASVPQYLMAKYIKENTDIKVLLSGEGADELFAGYQYSKKAPSDSSLHEDTINLLKELYLFDNLRTDRTMAAFGLEVRVPFLDKFLTDYIMALPPKLRMCSNRIEKNLLRSSFLDKSNPDKYLPYEILYRNKEAFSDAVSSKETSWYKTLIEQFIEPIVSDLEFDEIKQTNKFNKPLTKEAAYYRKIFNEKFNGHGKLIPHFWMPKWCGSIIDPSATILDCHKGGLGETQQSELNLTTKNTLKVIRQREIFKQERINKIKSMEHAVKITRTQSNLERIEKLRLDRHKVLRNNKDIIALRIEQDAIKKKKEEEIALQVECENQQKRKDKLKELNKRKLEMKTSRLAKLNKLNKTPPLVLELDTKENSTNFMSSDEYDQNILEPEINNNMRENTTQADNKRADNIADLEIVPFILDDKPKYNMPKNKYKQLSRYV